MAQFPQLRILDTTSLTRELDLVSELFHRINRIIPENQHLLTIPPETTVREAVSLMLKHGYSQVPVVAGGEVLGVFSYRAFSPKSSGMVRRSRVFRCLSLLRRVPTPLKFSVAFKRII